jgi:hypothetical protein
MTGCSISGYMKGGKGVAEFAQGVYGKIGGQHAVSPTDHTIAMNAGANCETMTLGGNSVAPINSPIQSGGAGLAETSTPFRGGAQQQQQQQNSSQQNQNGGKKQQQEGGKTIIGDLLVPAGFLLASQTLLRGSSKKRGGKRKSRKTRRNRRSRRRP